MLGLEVHSRPGLAGRVPCGRRLTSWLASEERFEALSAIGGALEEVKWRDLKIKPSARMTQETLKALEHYRDRPEVRRILRKIEAGDAINSRD